MLKDLLEKEIDQGRFWNKAWSLVEGCTPVSPGCANCWLASMANRFYGCHDGDNCIVSAAGHFNGHIICREDRLDIPLRRRKPTVYAVWSDLFHESVDRQFIVSAFSTMLRAPQHYYLIVTKRPHVAVQQLNNLDPKLFRNIMILITVENQQWADRRVPYAMKLALLGWNVGIIAEPLLSGLDLCFDIWPVFPKWLITGGESGTGARPAHPDWVRSLRDQVQAAGVPFLFKQWGEWAPEERYLARGGASKFWRRFNGYTWTDIPVTGSEDDWMVKVGKKAAGRLLDEQEHDEVPEI